MENQSSGKTRSVQPRRERDPVFMFIIPICIKSHKEIFLFKCYISLQVSLCPKSVEQHSTLGRDRQ